MTEAAHGGNESDCLPYFLRPLHKASRAIGIATDEASVGQALMAFASSTDIDVARLLLFTDYRDRTPCSAEMREGWSRDRRRLLPYGTRLDLGDLPLLELIRPDSSFACDDVKSDEDLSGAIKDLIDQLGLSSFCVIPLTTRTEPGISEYHVTEENDLQSKLYRSPTAKVEIPELEVNVEPGPAAPFYFTNIEGVLARFEKAVVAYRNSLAAENLDTKDIDEILDNFKKAYLGTFPFTLRIIDSYGGSYIIPKDESKYTFIKHSS